LNPAGDKADSRSSAPEPIKAPALWRRLACFVYEGVLLFGVLMIAGYLYSSLTQMRHALHGKLGLQLFLFAVLGVYFVWFWSRGGQTVAMRAWNIRLVDVKGQAVSQRRALVRYLLSWLWFLPALVVLGLAGAGGLDVIFGALFIGVLGYALLARLHPEGQFWHDVVSGTRLVTSQPKATRPASA
jgi:uncharacterized RDD family membrane protein YckC